MSTLPKESIEHFDLIAEPFTTAMNAIEAFAVHFTTGVAADLPAFNCVGRTYCSTMEDLLPHLAPLAADGYYKNAVTLYGIWSARFELMKLEEQRASLEKKRGECIDFTLPTV